MRTITHVAVKYNNHIYSLPKPNRHHNVIWMIAKDLSLDYVNATGEDQGFIDSAGQYLNRTQALAVALEANQVRNIDDVRANQLFSEDLW